ncbi:MAG: helix-turn-helix transcriptional regulator [Bacteroidales bacterium]|nr:helix-turn-helix transcriptional regulator [Bacteroidales bacterium]
MVITEEDNVIRISKKEHRIIQLIAEGKTSPEIAKELCLTLPTIKWYRKKLKEKLNVESTAMLIRFAIQQGLI